MGNVAEQANDLVQLKRALDYAKEAFASDTSLSNYIRGQLRYNSGIAAYKICSISVDLNSCEMAITFFDQAIALLPVDTEPVSWAHSQTNRGITQLLLGDKRKDVHLMLDGVESLKSSLEVWRPHESTHRWWQAKSLQAKGLQSIGELTGDPKYFELAVICMEDAMDYISHDNESANLLEARVQAADNSFVLFDRFKHRDSETTARQYYEAASKIVVERMVSGLADETDAEYTGRISDRLRILGKGSGADCVKPGGRRGMSPSSKRHI